jgi:serine/threonine protein kinase
MQADSNIPPAAPAELCGYSVAATLAAAKTYLAIGPCGRGLVLKKLDEECLLRGQLHPNIRERLTRVREVPHGGIANLHGIGADPHGPYLIWEHVAGVPFDQFAAAPGRSPREVAVAARGLAQATASLHLRGIVHGALVAGNILVDAGGAIRLTHVSPLLYTDTSVDAESVLALLWYVIEQRGETDAPLGRLIAAARAQKLGLRDLGSRLAAFIESRDADEPTALPDPAANAPRRWALLGAAVVAFFGLAVAGGIWFAVQGGLTIPDSFRF